MKTTSIHILKIGLISFGVFQILFFFKGLDFGLYSLRYTVPFLMVTMTPYLIITLFFEELAKKNGKSETSSQYKFNWKAFIIHNRVYILFNTVFYGYLLLFAFTFGHDIIIHDISSIIKALKESVMG